MVHKTSVLLLASLIIVCVAGPAWADIIHADSSIAQAVVYPSTARVMRVAKVVLKPGAQTIRLNGVQPQFDEKSLSVAGHGSAAVKILGAGIKMEFLQRASDERVRELEARIQAMDDELAGLNTETAVFEEKKAFLNSVRLFTGGQLPKDMVTRVPTAEELKNTLAFLEDGTKQYEQGSLKLRLQQREKSQALQALRQELNQLRSTGGNQQRVLSIDVECEKAGEFTLEVSYSVNQVGWYPLYDARVEFEKGKVVLSSFAVVRQTTGEDWQDVRLTLSTAKPSVGGRMPELNSWHIRPRQMYQTLAGGRGRGVSDGIAMKSAAMNEVMAMDSDKAMAAPLMEAVNAYATAETKGAALVYVAARPATVLSDGSETRVPLNTQVLDTTLEYAATPKLSPFAYLTSKVINSPAEQLLAGRVNVFLDGTYVGNSDIQKTIAPRETFDLYLGVDEGLTVKRELIEEKSDDTIIGMIPSPTMKMSYVYKLSVESYKPRAVTLKLFDQIPVAQDDKIRVTRVNIIPKPDTDKYQDRAGVCMWTLMLQPKEKKEITTSYVVEYPRDMNIEGL